MIPHPLSACQLGVLVAKNDPKSKNEIIKNIQNTSQMSDAHYFWMILCILYYFTDSAS